MDSLSEVLSYSTAHLRKELKKLATHNCDTAWLVCPWKSMKNRVCLVAHIDTVHDKLVSATATVSYYPKTNQRPDYVRVIREGNLTKTYDCIRDQSTSGGEYRREQGSKWDRWTWTSETVINQNHGVKSYPPRVVIEKAKKEEEAKYRLFDLFHDPERNVYWSPDGLGADDRAGVWGIWKIYNTMPKTLRPALLFTDGEESGCIGARDAIKEWAELLGTAMCFIELDRKGHNDAVYYNTEPEAWRKVFSRHGFKTTTGTTSDVSVLGRETNVCTVNLSIGYMDHHRPHEHLYATVAESITSKVERIIRELTAMKTQWTNKKAPVKPAQKNYDYDDEAYWEDMYQDRMMGFGSGYGHNRLVHRHGEIRHRKRHPTIVTEWIDLHPPEYWDADFMKWLPGTCHILNCTKCDKDLPPEEEDEDAGSPLGQIAYESMGTYGMAENKQHLAITEISAKRLEKDIAIDLPHYCEVCMLFFGDSYYSVPTQGFCPICSDEATDAMDAIDDIKEAIADESD